MGDNQIDQMSAEEQQEIKNKLLEVIQDHVKADDKFTEIDTKEISKKISESGMQLLMAEELLSGYKMYVKATILQVNGMASSSNTLWTAQDLNLSVSWTNDEKCSVWLTVIVNPNPPTLPQ